MIIKLIGGALLISSGIILGSKLNYIYKERVILLERFQSFVIFCESEVEYYKTEINKIIEKFKNNDSIYDKIIFDNKTESLYITNENKKYINNFFNTIITLDSETQKYFFNKTKNDSATLLEKAKKDLMVKGRMFKRLIPVIFVGIFVLLL